MTRRFPKIILLVVAASALICVAVGFFLREIRGIRVGTAVVSKMLCSGVFVSGLDPDLLYAEAVKPIPGQTLLAKRLRYKVDRTARQVTATWAGAFQSRAVYHDGFGCILLHDDEPNNAGIGNSPATGAVMPPAPNQTAPLEVQPQSPKLECHGFRAGKIQRQRRSVHWQPQQEE